MWGDSSVKTRRVRDRHCEGGYTCRVQAAQEEVTAESARREGEGGAERRQPGHRGQADRGGGAGELPPHGPGEL